MLVRFVGKNRNNAIYKSVIISFVVLILFTFVLVMTLYYRAESVLENVVYKYNEMLIDGVVTKVDQHQNSIERLMNELYNDESIIKVLNSEVYNEADAKNVMYKLQQHGYGYDYVSDIQLYIESHDMMISRNSILHSKDFFEMDSMIASDYGYEGWKNEYLSGVQYKKYFLPVKMNMGNFEREIIYYGQSYPQDEIENIKGRIYILIDEKMLLNEIQVSRNIRNENGNLFVLDSGRRIIMSTTEDETALRSTLKNMKGGTRGIVESTDGEHVCVYIRSKIGLNSWTCLYLLSRESFLGEINSFKNGIFIIFFMFIIAACIFVLIMTNKTYAPIKNALVKLKIIDDVNKRHLNEIDLIMDRMESLEQQRDELDVMTYKQTMLGKSVFLLRFLQNRVRTNELSRMTGAFGIEFPYDYFCVVAVKPESFGVFSEKNQASEQELLSVGVANIFEELLEGSGIGKCYVIEHKIILALINYSGENRTVFESDIGTVLDEFSAVVKKELEVDVSIGVSDLGKGTESVPECYNNALAAVEYDSEAGVGVVSFFRRIKDEFVKKKLYYYSFESENRISNYIRQGDFENVSMALDEIMSVNVKLKLDESMAKQLCGELLGTLLRTAGSLNISESLVDELVSKDEDFDKMSLYESFSVLKEKYRRVCDVAASQGAGPSKGLVGECVEYIKENYMKYDMDVSMIANHFGVTRQTVFNLFKQNLNISPSDYITHVRLDKAKQLLRESRLNNTQVADAVGFASDVSFVRVFKKSEGITPKKYRDMKPD